MKPLLFILCLLFSFELQAQDTLQRPYKPTVSLSSSNIENPAFEWGLYLTESRYVRYMGEKLYKFELAYQKGDHRAGRFVYHAKEHETIIINPQDDLREINLDVCFWGVEVPPTKRFITTHPSRVDTAQSLKQVLIDMLQFHPFYAQQNIEEPRLIIAQLKKSPDMPRPLYIYVIWDAAKIPAPPAFITNKKGIVDYEIIEFEIQKFRVHEFFYLDISQNNTRKLLIDRLKGKTTQLEENGNRYTLYLSNSNAPYIAHNKKEKRKLIKRIRILQPDSPDPGADVTRIQRQIRKHHILQEQNKTIFHFYLSDSFYQTNRIETASDKHAKILFIEKILASYGKNTNLEVYFYLENENKQFTSNRYLFNN